MTIPGNFLSETTSSIEPNTSGWRPRLNGTFFNGTGGRVGDRCLGVDSVAAGEVQAETASAYSVLPGETYQVFADASGAAQPERIGIEWLASDGAQVAVTWSDTTEQAMTAWHRVGVAGVCPLGAVSARVLLSFTAAGADVSHYWENIYFGLPHRQQGNLLPFNVESGGELDTTGWAAEANATVGRSVPAVVWSASWYLGGAHVMTLTASAPGDASMVATVRASAQAGVEYLGYTYLGPPTTAADAWVELRFYDAADVQISAVRGPLDAASAGFQRQRVSAVAPAGTATVSIAAGLDGAAAGEVLRVEGTGILASPVLTSGSIVPYADASFEQGPGSWQVVSGPAVLARTSPWGAVGLDGTYALHITSATTAVSTLRSGRFPLGEGITEWRLRVSYQVAAGSWTWTRRVRWYDAGGLEVGTFASSGAALTPGWWSVTSTGTSPAGAVEAELELELTPGVDDSELYLDWVALWRDEPLVETTAHPETGSVTLVMRELSEGQYMTLYRVGADGQRTLVRGSTGMVEDLLVEQDLLVFEDYEAPQGVPVRYWADLVDSGGATAGYRESSTVTVDPGDINEAWLKDPGFPHRNIRVLVQAAPEWTRPVEQAVMRPRGRRHAVVHSDVRGGLEGTLTVWTRSDEERAALHWLLDAGRVLLWQAAPGMGVDDLYVQVGEVSEARVSAYAPEPWRAWSLPLVQQDVPLALGVAATAGRSWRDVLATHGTWQDVMDRYATWEDVLLDRPIAGGG
ncbi:hypothetical protein JJV70_02045 [Streptomyces sp. JJ66]|uniref:hypothetical protein n=1 Tax=Streptomyces sp. JJ66 TaxID=2803843 RepID=UPI001C58AF43|nr:hypothetical protein [Streptomyces sp. JJ66]MBW1600902.1 hypothetical protein [Streptomyces sp. JJ66]